MNQPTALRVHRPSPVNPFAVNRNVLASDLSPAAKVLYLVILDHARHGASKCTASTRTLAAEASITERHARNVLADLEARKLIAIERATGSVHSRHTITVGQCMHQVGKEFPLRLHEVGTDFPEVGNEKLHEVGTGRPCKDSRKDSDKDGCSLPPGEEISPWTRKYFGKLIDTESRDLARVSGGNPAPSPGPVPGPMETSG